VIRRIDSSPQPLRKLGLARRAATLVPFEEQRDPDLALQYSNGFVTVEISYDALDRYIEMYGDVPLPIRRDPETGDKRTWDNKNKVKVIYDREMHLREITSRTREGLHVRVNFPAVPAADERGAA
jgi:hypothetical protein